MAGPDQNSLTQSYVNGTSAKPLLGDTIGAHFDKTVARWRDHDALVVRHQDIRWTWGELQARVDDLAAGLIELGLAPGARIGIWSPNNMEWAVTQFATAKAGLILVNINPAYRLTELEFALNKVECTALITATAFKSSDYAGMLRDLAPEIDSAAPGDLHAAKLPHLRTVIQIGGDSAGMYKFEDVLARGAGAGHGALEALAGTLQFDD
ncbi:MAG: AMP-binding protein, partial [Alphaproteobacteria bacterium]